MESDGLSIVQCAKFKPYKSSLDELFVKPLEQEFTNVESEMNSLLCLFFSERSHHERLHYNSVSVTNKNVFDWAQDTFPMDFFLNVFYKVVFKQNVNRVNKENCLNFYGFKTEISLKNEKTQLVKLAKKDMQKKQSFKRDKKSGVRFKDKPVEVDLSATEIHFATQ